MADQAKAFNAEQVSGSAKAAEVRRAEIQQLQSESQALTQLADSARRTNVQLLYGGRNDMQQHLGDMDRLLNYQILLNRQQWLGFSTVQQAMAYRQQMYNQKLLENKADFAGYLTADQYLAYMAKRTQAASLESAAIKARAQAVQAETQAVLAYDNAVQGSHQTIGQLGEGLTSVSALSDAISALPDAQVTTLELDDAGFRAKLAIDRNLLAGLPRSESTEVLAPAALSPTVPRSRLQLSAGERPDVGAHNVAYGPAEEDAAARALAAEMARLTQQDEATQRVISRALSEDFRGGSRYLPPGGGYPPPGGGEPSPGGGEPAPRPGTDLVVEAEFDDVQARSGLQMWVHELLAAVQRKYEFFAALDDSEALTELDALMARFRAGETGALRLAAGLGGAAGGGGGGGPPPAPGPEPSRVNPGDEAAARALREEMIRLAAAEDEAAAGAQAAGEAAGISAEDFLRAAAAATSGARAYAYVRAAALAAKLAQDAAAKSAQDAAGSVRAAGGGIPPMVDGLVAAAGGWFGLNSQLRLFGGLMPGVLGHVAAWHVLVDFIIEGLAVFVPALVTLAADLTAFGVAGVDAGRQVYARLVAIHTASDALQQTLAPMTGQLEKLHNTVRPMVWQLYGDAIDIAHTKTGLFNQLAIQTGGVLDRLAAHVTVFATSAGRGLETFFSVGNADLAKLGTFFDNLGRALLSLIKVTQETHVDQIFLNFFVALSQLLVLITKLPTPVLAAAVALHAFWLWGGLAATVVLQLLNPLRALALALGAVSAEEVAGGLAGLGKDASAFSRLKAGLTDIAAGFAALPARIGTGVEALAGKLGLVSKASGEAAAAVEGAAAGEAAAGAAAGEAAAGTDALAGGFGALLGIPVAGWLAALGIALVSVGVYLGLRADQTQRWIETMDTALGKVSAFKIVGQTMADLAATSRELATAQRDGTGNATELANAQADLSGKLSTELDHVGQVSHAYGVSMPMALALLNSAGVKTSAIFSQSNQVWAQALQQVDGLVQGYKAMGQGMSEIQRDVSVQLVLGSDQYKNMQTLNTAWDSFQKLVAAPVSGILATAQALSTFTADAKAAGASMTGLNAPSLTLQTDFQTAYGDVETLFSSLRSAEAVTGDGGFAGAVKNAVQVLIPLAGSNKAAASEISQLAQEAGGPATTSLAALSKWAGSTHDPLAALYQDAQNATIGASSLDQDAARLTSTLQSDLNPAMAAAAFNAMGGQKAFNTFASDLAKFGPNAQPTIDAGRVVAQELLSIDKNSASAKAQFAGWAESMGLSRDQADKLWAEVSKGVKPMQSVRDSIAGAAGEIPRLASPGLWGQVEHAFMSFWDKMRAHPLTFALGGVLNLIPGVTSALDKAGSVISGFFGRTLPDLITRTLPNLARDVAGFFAGPFASAVTGAWAHAWSALVSPVARAFDAVKHAITTGFDGWWKTHGSALEAIWGSTVKDLTWIWDNGSAFVAGSARKFWEDLTGIFRRGAGGASQVASQMWRDVKAAAQGFWGLFGPLVRAGWDAVAGVFRIAAAAVTGIGKAMWDTLLAVARIAWAALKAAAKIGWDAIVLIFSTALNLITGHWHTAWLDIENYGKQVWNALRGFFSSTWSAIRADFTQVLGAVKSSWQTTWGAIESAARSIWGNLKAGFSNVVSSIKTTWSTLEGIFKAPVSFLVNTVYDSGIARLWNDVMGAIGGPKLPVVKFEAGGAVGLGGGRLAGYGGGDIVPAWIKGQGPALLEPGEAVVDKERTRKYAPVLRAMGVPGFQSGGFVGDLGHILGGIGHGIVSFLGDTIDVGKIVAAVLTGNTAALGNAMTKLVGPDGATGELAQMITGIPATMIRQLLSSAGSLAKKAVSSFTGSGPAPAGANASAVAALKAAAALHGWTSAAEWNALNYVEMREAGYNIHAQNPSSGAYGMAQFINGAGEYAQYGGDPNTAWGQSVAMCNYIAQRYGDPIAAAAHEQAMSWYSGGGVVGFAAGGEVPVPELAGFHAGQAHNILVAAGLRPTAAAGQLPSWWTTGSAPRATAHVPPHSAVAIHASKSSRPQGIRLPDLAGYTAGTAHNILAAEGLVPAAAKGQKATWLVTGSSPGKGTGAHAGERVQIIAPAPRTPAPPENPGTGVPPPGTSVPAGSDAGQAWTAYSAQLSQAKADEAGALWAYVGAHRPKLTVSQWEGDYSDRLILAWQQDNLYNAFNKVMAGTHDPANMTGTEWASLTSAAALQQNWIYGAIPPRNVWGAEKTGGPGLRASWPKGYKPGTYSPSGWPGWKYAHAQWAAANSKASVLRTTVSRAFNAWNALYGPGGPLSTGVIFGGGTPGIAVQPDGTAGTPSIPVNLEPLIPGGPPDPVVTTGPSLSATGMGFAAGGLVGGDGAALGDVASMFALGGMVPHGLPAMGLSPRLAGQLVTATAAQGVPRTVSEAGGDRIGVKVGSLTINNPLKEETQQSIARSVSRLSFLAGRGPV